MEHTMSHLKTASYLQIGLEQDTGIAKRLI